MDPKQPVIIQGPCVVERDGAFWYTKSGVSVRHARETFKVESDNFGETDERFLRDIVEVTFTPDGQLFAELIAATWPYKDGSLIGTSIFGAADVALKIHTKGGDLITYQRSGISRMPNLKMNVKESHIGEMTMMCLGKRNTSRITAAAWRAVASVAAFPATSPWAADPDRIITDIYTAVYDTVEIGSMDGFEIGFDTGIEPIQADDIGYATHILKSLAVSLNFKPSNLTDAAVQTLMKYDGAGALQPGQSIGRTGKTFLIESATNPEGLKAELFHAGPKDANWMFALGKHRHEGLTFVTTKKATAGALGDIFNIEMLTA